MPVRRHRIPGADGLDLRERDHNRERQLCESDGGDEHDDARRGEQPANHRDLHERAVERADGQARDHREPERDAVVDDHDCEQRSADEAHVPDREVDHACRAVDQHDAHGKQPDDEPGDEAVEHELLRDPRRDDHDG